jgi:hypothetical protein
VPAGAAAQLLPLSSSKGLTRAGLPTRSWVALLLLFRLP